MILDEIESHIKNYEFNFAKEKLIKIIEDNSFDQEQVLLAFDKILELNSKDQSMIHMDVISQYFQYLEKNNLETLLLESIAKYQLQIDRVPFQLKLIILNAFWKAGNIEKYKNFSNQIAGFLVIEKRWNLFPQFLTQVQDKILTFSLELAGIVYCLECEDYESAKVKIEDLIQKYIINHRYEIENLNKLDTALSEFEVSEGGIYYKKLQINVLAKLSQKKEIPNKVLIELILLAKDSFDYTLIFQLIRDEGLIQFCQKNKIKMNQKIFSFYQNLGAKRSKISIEKIEEPIAPVIDWNDGEFVEPESKTSSRLKTPKTQFEIELMTQFKNEKINPEKRVEYITALIHLNLFYVALELTNELTDSSNKEYLLAEIHLRLNDLASVIYHANNAIDVFGLCDRDQLPFLYLKAQAYELNSKFEDSKNIYREIAKIDPEFRNAVRKL